MTARRPRIPASPAAPRKPGTPIPEDRTPNDPRYLAQATALAQQCNSAPLSWRIQLDGSLTVILVSGSKINSAYPLPPELAAPTDHPAPPPPSVLPRKPNSKQASR